MTKIPAPLHAKKSASSAMIDFGVGLTKAANRLLDMTPPQGSVAASFAVDGVPAKSPALSSASLAYSSMTDHFHAVARLIRGEELLATSVATLTRGCIEAAGRAWWLLEEADNPTLFEHRAAALKLKDLKYLVKHNMQLETLHANGISTPLTAADLENEAKAELAARNSGVKVTLPSYTQMAVSILTESGVPTPEIRYSQLSGVAHGESFSLSSYTTFNEGRDNLGHITLAVSPLFQMISDCVSVSDKAVTRLIEIWDSPQELERWSQVRNRAYKKLETIENRL